MYWACDAELFFCTARTVEYHRVLLSSELRDLCLKISLGNGSYDFGGGSVI